MSSQAVTDTTNKLKRLYSQGSVKLLSFKLLEIYQLILLASCLDCLFGC